MSLKEDSPGTIPLKVGEKADTTHTGSESDSGDESDHFASSSKTQMDSTKDTNVTAAESNTKKSAESKEVKVTASGSEDSKEKAKDTNTSDKDQPGVLIEGFCGFEDAENPILTRSAREASRNATTILTKKSNAKQDKSERKSDSPPDLVLFLKEGRGRAQNYSDPPRLDPESIATRRRTRVPEDPLALISKAKPIVPAEKTKKDQKESSKKEKKAKVMETPESLKRLAREGSKLGQMSGKESLDSGSEEKILKKAYSKGAAEGDVKVRSRETSTGSEEEQPGSISRRSIRGKRNSTDEPEELVSENLSADQSAIDLTNSTTSYSNLGTILNKMTKNNADRRIPVVIMSKSEKGPKNDAAKPRSKKKPPSDQSSSTAVLKIASMAHPTISAVKSSGMHDESHSSEEINAKLSSEDMRSVIKSCKDTGLDPETGHDIIVLKVTSDVKPEEKDRLAKTKANTVSNIPSESSSNAAEKIQMKHTIVDTTSKEQAKFDNVSGAKETAAGGSSQPAVVRAVQGNASIRFNSAPVKASLVSSPIKSSLIISPVNPDSNNLSIRPRPLPTPIRSGPVVPHGKPKPIVSSIKSSSGLSPVRSGPVMQSTKSAAKSGPTSSPAKSEMATLPVKSATVTSPVKSGTMISPVKSGTVTSTIKSGTSPIKSSITSFIKPNTVTPPIKSATVTSSIKSGIVTATPKSNSLSMKSGIVTSSLKSGPSIKSSMATVSSKSGSLSMKAGIITSSSKSGLSVKSGIVTSSPKSGPSVKPGIVTSSSTKPKPTTVMSPISQSQKNPPFVVSMSQIVTFGGAKGSAKMTNITPSKMGLKGLSTKGTSATQNLKRDITFKPESCTNTDSSVAGDKSQGVQITIQPVPSSSSSSSSSSSPLQKAAMLDYTDIETQEVVLGETDDSSGQIGSVGDMPESALLAQEEMESSSEEDTFKVPELSNPSKKDSLSPEGRVALDHSYSSGGSATTRKKSPSTYEKSLTPRPVYSNASTAKRSMDIMLHNDKINILRQMSQIFNDERPPQQIFSDEKTAQSEADITMSSSDGEDDEEDEEEPNVCVTKSKEKGPLTKCSSKTPTGNTTDAAKKGTNPGQTSNAIVATEHDSLFSEHTPSKSSATEAELKEAGDITMPTDANTSSISSSSASSSSNKENGIAVEFTTPPKGRKGENGLEDGVPINIGSPFLGFPDPDPKVHHVPAYSVALNERILVQSKVGPVGEMIDIVDGFSFTSFTTEQEMMSYDGTCTGKSTKAHRQWLKKRRKRRKRLIKYKRIRFGARKVPVDQMTSNVSSSVTSLRDKGSAADSGAFASDDLDMFLDKNSRLNISYQIPKCKVTEEGVSKIDEEELLDPIPPVPPPPLQAHPPTPIAPSSPPPPPSPSPPHTPHAETEPAETKTAVGVNPNTSALEQHELETTKSESVDQYEEVNAIDILYPKEKYKYYYNKELCKETKADASDVFVRRAGKLVPLSTVFKSHKSPLPELSPKKSVELVYVYDGGKLLTLGGSLTKINPSNSDSVRARVVLPVGIPPIQRGETVESMAKKVQAVEINEDMAKFALSALQSSYQKSEEMTEKKADGEEECPPIPESSPVVEEKMEVDEPEAAPVVKTELTIAKIAPASVPPKPTKTNILDIIAAKLAMSDEESDGKDEAEEKQTAVDMKDAEGDVKEDAVNIKEAISDRKEAVSDTKETYGDLREAAIKPSTVEEKEGATIKGENQNVKICLTSQGTSEKNKESLVKQEELQEGKSEGKTTVKPQDLEEGEAVEPKVEVKQEGAAPVEILLSDDVDDRDKEKEKLCLTTAVADLVNVDKKENRNEVIFLKEKGKTSELEQLTDKITVSDAFIGKEKFTSKELVLPKEEALRLKGKDSVSGVHLEKKGTDIESLVSYEEKELLSSGLEDGNMSKISKVKGDKSYLNALEKKKERKLTSQEKNNASHEEDDPDSSNRNFLENLERKNMGAVEKTEMKQRKDSTLNEGEANTETVSKAVLISKTGTNILSEAFKDRAQGTIGGKDSLTPPESVVSVADAESGTESPRSTVLLSSQESGDRMDIEEKDEFSESGTPDTFRMDIKTKVFKKNMHRFPSLSREMKRLNMNFVNFVPPQEPVPDEEETIIPEMKENCTNEHCKLGCVCDSLLCQRKSVEHCGRVECMFDCTCRDESWKLPSGSGRTMNAVSIFNLDREQKEGLALREKDFRRTVIQTGSEVILVGAERKKREIRLPGRYRESVWTDSDLAGDINTNNSPDLSLEPGTPLLEPPDCPLLPDYPGIPLSEASKYIKKFKLNIPWYDIKGISIWCMDHSCYDCRCLTDPAFYGTVRAESFRKNSFSKAKPEPTALESVFESSSGQDSVQDPSSESSSLMMPTHEGNSEVKSIEEPSASISSALRDFEEALRRKNKYEEVREDKKLKKAFVPRPNCSIVNIIVNNSETRRKYTWKLKEWYHCTDVYSARTAGHTKKNITEETKNMTLTGLAARDTTPEQIVESVVRSLRQQKSPEEVKLPALPFNNNFEPFMGDSLTNLQNAIGFNPCTSKKPIKAETSYPVVDLTSGNEDTGNLPMDFAEPRRHKGLKTKNAKGVTKRKLSVPDEPVPKKAHSTKFEDRTEQVDSSNFSKSYLSNLKEKSVSAQKKKTLSLLEMMVAEENRGELELDLSENIPGNALLVAEARFRKLINMNIIGVIGINKAGRCIIGTVDSDEALQVMHQIQNMIRNNTLDVGPNMREIFFPPPYVGIRPRYVMIRCDSHCKWEIVGVVQKKGPGRPNKAEVKTKVNSPVKPQVPQVIDLEEEEREKQVLVDTCDVKQEQDDFVEPPSPDERDSGAWEGSLPLITSVRGASDSNMAELIGSPEAIQEEFEETQVAQVTPTTSSHETSPAIRKVLPDLVPIASSSNDDTLFPIEEQGESLSVMAQDTGSENPSQQKLYFVPTGFNVSTSTTTTATTVPGDTPMKSITLNVASNKVFGQSPEKSASSSSRSYSLGKVSYILPKLPGSGSTDSNILLSKQTDATNSDSKVEEQSDSDNGQIPSSKMLYIPVTTGGVSKVLLVPTVSGASSRMMLLPTIPGSSSLENSSASNSATTTTTTIITTPITSSTSSAVVATSKMKMVLVPSSQDGSKMLLIPTGLESSDSAAVSSVVGNSLSDGDGKKMLVLPSSVINNFISRTSSEPASTQPYQQSCKGTLFVPLPNTANLSNTLQPSETEKCSSIQEGENNSQDSSDDVIVIDPTTENPTTSRKRTYESCSVSEETPSLQISPAPFASSSGVAETNVVSSLTTISSTLQKNSPLLENRIESNSEVPSPVKQSSKGGVNTLFIKTHEEMMADTKSSERSLPMIKECESGKESEKGSAKAQRHDSNIGKAKDMQDQKKQVLIKKSGFHWSAVDLSLNFKSVKLEWLLGTIRKNVLMNIYHMSKKTLSPVTLSVKNGTSISMLYGFARAHKTSTLPILILGSVVSAVLSSSSVPDSMLFQINSIKYFIRENTGELSSYTYSSETHLVKLASKKRGNTGEMVGIGEKVEIDKMRDPEYQEAGRAYDTLNFSGHTAQMRNACTCSEGLLCPEHFASASTSKQAAESAPSQYHSEDSSSRMSLENESGHASLGFQGNPVTNIQPQDDFIESFSATEKPQSELRHLLTKAKGQRHMKKPLVDRNTEELISYSKGDNHPDAPILISDGNVKSKARGESSSSVSSVGIDLSGMEHVEEILVPKLECESEDEVVDVEMLGDPDCANSILNSLRQQLEHETVEAVQKFTYMPPCKDGKRKTKFLQEAPPLKKAKTNVLTVEQPWPTVVSSSGVEWPCPQSKKSMEAVKKTRKGMKLKYLSLEDKLKVLERVDSGATMQMVCIEFGVKPSTFYDIKKNRDKIRQQLLVDNGSSKIRKVDIIETMESTGVEEQEDKDAAESSRFPTHLSQLWSSPEDSSLLVDDDLDSISVPKGKTNANKTKQLQLMAALSQNKQKAKVLFDEGQNDERNSELHNKLERMRRKVMRHLFLYLQGVIVRVPRNPLVKNTLVHPKKSVLNAGTKVCEILRSDERRLIMEEEKVRSERSSLIKHLAGIIGDSTEEIKVKWRNWVKEHMQNPTAKHTFENTWQPFRLMEDILKNVVEENTFDMDYDEGSPLPDPSSPQSGAEKVVQQLQQQKVKRQPVKRICRKKKKKVGRPQKIVVNTGQGSAESEPIAPLPTSILLMAGTSSRGRKIVRKEDTNFVTS